MRYHRINPRRSPMAHPTMNYDCIVLYIITCVVTLHSYIVEHKPRIVHRITAHTAGPWPCAQGYVRSMVLKQRCGQTSEINQLPRTDLILSTPAGGGTVPGPAPVKTSRHASKSRCTALTGAAIGWGAPAPRRGRRCRRRPCAPASLSSGRPPLDSTRIKALAWAWVWASRAWRELWTSAAKSAAVLALIELGKLRSSRRIL